MAALALRPLSIGEILDASFQVYRRHFSALATIVLVCNGLPILLQIYGRAGGGVHWTLTLLYAVLVVVLSLVATGATVFVVSESYLGARSLPGTRWPAPCRLWSRSSSRPCW